MPASGFLTSCAMTAAISPKLGERGLLAQLLLHLHASAEIVEDAGELPLAVDGDLADGQMQRKRRAVLAAAPAPRVRCR